MDVISIINVIVLILLLCISIGFLYPPVKKINYIEDITVNPPTRYYIESTEFVATIQNENNEEKCVFLYKDGIWYVTRSSNYKEQIAINVPIQIGNSTLILKQEKKTDKLPIVLFGIMEAIVAIVFIVLMLGNKSQYSDEENSYKTNYEIQDDDIAIQEQNNFDYEKEINDNKDSELDRENTLEEQTIGTENEKLWEDHEMMVDEQRMKLSHSISAGIRYSAGITNSGKVLYAGENTERSHEIDEWNNIISIAIDGEYALGLNEWGEIKCTRLTLGQQIDTSEWTDIIEIAAGELYIVGLKSDGTVISQGHNGDNQRDVDEWNNIIAIDTGWRHTVGLRSDGEIEIVGYGAEKQLEEIAKNKSEWTNIVSISAGGGGSRTAGGIGNGHTVALKEDGTVVAVGDNTYGQCEVNEWSDIIAISAGDTHTVGLKKDGTVITTLKDGNEKNKIESWTDIVEISAGYKTTLGLRSDGTVVAEGYDAQGQIDIDDWTDIFVK